MVIGGAPVVEAQESVPLAAIRRAPDDRALEAAEASRIAQISPSRFWSSRHILAAAIHAGPHLSEGFLFVVSWDACTVDGRVVDTDVRLVHVSARMRKPVASAIAVRAIAVATIAEQTTLVLRTCEPWAQSRLVSASDSHRAITTRLLDRERFHLASPTRSELFQPGLFDRRATHEAERDHIARDALAVEHQRRIDWLERSISLQGNLRIAGLLIVTGSRAG